MKHPFSHRQIPFSIIPAPIAAHLLCLDAKLKTLGFAGNPIEEIHLHYVAQLPSVDLCLIQARSDDGEVLNCYRTKDVKRFWWALCRLKNHLGLKGDEKLEGEAYRKAQEYAAREEWQAHLFALHDKESESLFAPHS